MVAVPGPRRHLLMGACIYDVPIESIALPDPSDRYYSSALVKRLEIQTRNQSNRARRLTIVFNTRTRLFGMLIRSVKVKNPGFAQEMQEQCAIDDRSGTAVYGSRHRDGPKGYRMIQIHLTSAKGRSEYDKMYYKIAYELQVKEVLPEGCSSVLYERTVQAFLHYILPNLAQSLDDEDAARHIVNKMPDNLLPEARLHFDVDNRGGAGSVSSLRHRVDLHHAVAEVHRVRV